MDRKRKGKKVFHNNDRESPTDPEAKIVRMKDGRTRMVFKPEHAVDLDTDAVVTVPLRNRRV